MHFNYLDLETMDRWINSANVVYVDSRLIEDDNNLSFYQYSQELRCRISMLREALYQFISPYHNHDDKIGSRARCMIDSAEDALIHLIDCTQSVLESLPIRKLQQLKKTLSSNSLVLAETSE